MIVPVNNDHGYQNFLVNKVVPAIKGGTSMEKQICNNAFNESLVPQVPLAFETPVKPRELEYVFLPYKGQSWSCSEMFNSERWFYRCWLPGSYLMGTSWIWTELYHCTLLEKVLQIIAARVKTQILAPLESADPGIFGVLLLPVRREHKNDGVGKQREHKSFQRCSRLHHVRGLVLV